MSTPSRHRLPGSREVFEATIQSTDATLAKHLSGDQWAGEWTPSFARAAHDNALLRACLDPRDPQIVSHLEICACTTAAAHLAALTPGGEPLEVPAPGGRVVELTRSAAPKQLTPASQWRAGVFAAVVSRCAPALALLTNMAPAQLRALRPGPPWFETETAALSALFQQFPAAADLLRTAASGVDSAEIDALSRVWVEDVVVPELELGLLALSRDRAGFDGRLGRALEQHHHYYGIEENLHFHGQLALAPLALACFAHDLGLTTTLDSDYAPRWIIEG